MWGVGGGREDGDGEEGEEKEDADGEEGVREEGAWRGGRDEEFGGGGGGPADVEVRRVGKHCAGGGVSGAVGLWGRR